MNYELRTSNGQMKFGRRKSDGALLSWSLLKGGLAQLARAPALQAGGQRFESVILHLKAKYKNYKSYKTYKTYKSYTEQQGKRVH